MTVLHFMQHSVIIIIIIIIIIIYSGFGKEAKPNVYINSDAKIRNEMFDCQKHLTFNSIFLCCVTITA